MEWTDLSVIVGGVVAGIILAMAFLVLFKMFTGAIPLDSLLRGTDGTASLARFQFLLFSFVIAGIYLVLCLESGTLLDIPETVLGLIGISGGSYVLSKGITETAVKDVRVAKITKQNPNAPIVPAADQLENAAEKQEKAAEDLQDAANAQERAARRDPPEG